uniref:Major facilitator superfamily (MFS) profile domain-containing protein n=2 Tax=Plectus sambesii TaxID=2011161 RepID=A0A914V256_9BILA
MFARVDWVGKAAATEFVADRRRSSVCIDCCGGGGGGGGGGVKMSIESAPEWQKNTRVHPESIIAISGLLVWTKTTVRLHVVEGATSKEAASILPQLRCASISRNLGRPRTSARDGHGANRRATRERRLERLACRLRNGAQVPPTTLTASGANPRRSAAVRANPGGSANRFLLRRVRGQKRIRADHDWRIEKALMVVLDPARLLLKCVPEGWHPAIVITGGIAMQLTLGTVYTFGNMLPYIVSYLRHRVDSSQTKGSMIWLQTLSSGIPFAMLLGGFLEKRLGPRWGAFCGSVVFTSGVALSYFTIQKSFYLLLITYGFMFGLGQAITYNCALICAQRWLPNRVGLASGLIVGGFGCGAFIFSPIQTKFINPHNYVPDNDGYFYQSDLLDRVPSVFLLLAGIFALFQLFGVLLFVNPPDANIVTMPSEFNDENEPLIAHDGEENTDNSVEIRDVLRSSTFYALSVSLACSAIWVNITSGFYKTFGQTFINDDFFLAMVSSASSVCNALSRVVWGSIADKLSYQVAMACVSTIGAALMWSLLLTPFMGKMVFLFWVCAMFCCVGGTFSLMPVATYKCFGGLHFGINYGLVQIALSISGVLSALISQFLLPILGYSGLFLMVGCFSYIAFILTVTLHLTRHGRGKRTTRME